MWILSKARAQLDNPNTDLMEGHREAYLAYNSQRDALMVELEAYARQHFSPLKNNNSDTPLPPVQESG
jgi:hypothetical protein